LVPRIGKSSPDGMEGFKINKLYEGTRGLREYSLGAYCSFTFAATIYVLV